MPKFQTRGTHGPDSRQPQTTGANDDSTFHFLYNNQLLLPYQPNGIMEIDIGCPSEYMDERFPEALYGVCATRLAVQHSAVSVGVAGQPENGLTSLVPTTAQACYTTHIYIPPATANEVGLIQVSSILQDKCTTSIFHLPDIASLHTIHHYSLFATGRYSQVFPEFPSIIHPHTQYLIQIRQQDASFDKIRSSVMSRTHR